MDWRTTGDTTLVEFRTFLPDHSEIVKRGEVEAVYFSAQPFTRLVLGMLAAESSLATRFNAVPAANRNPLNLRRRGEATFQVFSSIAACVDEWRDRITSPTYKYKDTVTVRDLVEVYAPASDNNDVDKYVNTVESVINLLPRKEKPVPTLPAIPPVTISITPHAPNRPALEMPSAKWITVHEVGNTSPGADEEMHRRFVHSGGGSAQVSFHFVVGPTKVIQLLPLDEAAWHASDGYNGEGNRNSVAIETIQIGNFDRTLWNLSWLINEIAENPTRFNFNRARVDRLNIDAIKQHNDWAPDNKNCPQFIRDRGLWGTLMNRVDQWNAAGKKEEPVPEEEPEAKHQLPDDKSEALLRRLYGTAKNPETGKEEGFNLDFAPSQVWLAYGKRTGRFPELSKIIRRGDGGLLYTWADGFDWERKAPGVK